MLTRLQDRIESTDSGPIKIIRYGLWGTTAEIERRGRLFYIVFSNKKEIKFKTLAEAEVYMKELLSYR